MKRGTEEGVGKTGGNAIGKRRKEKDTIGKLKVKG
jgi:hypothetical protein